MTVQERYEAARSAWRFGRRAGDFVAGHDQRVIHQRIAKIGSVAHLIRWFDRHHDDDTELPSRLGDRHSSS
jgi:hypothetical protein